MPVSHVALVVESRRASTIDVSEVAAAIQRQVARDFAPIWDVEATVDAFPRLDQVPPGYWPVIVRDNLPQKGAIGIHLDSRGQPYALVRSVSYWPFVVSHEVLEMLVDPFGNRVVPGGSLKPGQGIVDYVVEPCDPCGSPRFGYSVNGILVSDFVTPNYYHDPVPVPGVRYSFTGAVERPRSVLLDGYVAWREPTTHEWFRAHRFGSSKLKFDSLGQLEFSGTPLRERIDENPALAYLARGVPEDDPAVRAANERLRSSRAASSANAGDWWRRIDTLSGMRAASPVDVNLPAALGGSGAPLLPHTPPTPPSPAVRAGAWSQLHVTGFDIAVAFYEAAFGATVVFRDGAGNPPIAQLTIAESHFWVQGELIDSPSPLSAAPGPTGHQVLLVTDVPTAMGNAEAAGGVVLNPPAEVNGWIRGRVRDPSGHVWEIVTPPVEWPPETA